MLEINFRIRLQKVSTLGYPEKMRDAQLGTTIWRAMSLVKVNRKPDKR